MSHAHAKHLDATYRALLTESSDLLTFSWDKRMGAALATYSADQAPAVTELLARYLPSRWGHLTIGQAPGVVQELAAARGGVQDGQWVAATDPDRGMLAVALVWPWNNGQTISVRVFPVNAQLPEAEHDAFVSAFQSWFGL